MFDEMNAKMYTEKAYYNQTAQEATCAAPAEQNPMSSGLCGTPAGRAYSPRDEASKNLRYHTDAAQKSAVAIQFFDAHPEFEEFIRLVRSGAIQF